MAKVLITGGTGLVGQHLGKMLLSKGYEIAILSRTKRINTTIPMFYWDINKNIIDKEAINSVDYIIHLSGVNIAGKRWTKKQKKRIVDSRVKSTELLFRNIDPEHKLKAFISASAIGYYGAITSNYIFTETDSPANDFLGETCRLWEESSNKFQNLGIRTVKIRTGVVLSKQSGALSKMIKPFKLGFGSALGSGKQFMPWIHIDDLCDIYIKAIEDPEINEAYNAVAPEHINNFEFSRKIAKQLKKPFRALKVPAFLLKIFLGEMANILLKGSRVSPVKIKASGYKFKYSNLRSALENLL